MICRRLAVQESIVIPPRSQMDIPTKTVYSNLKATRDAAGTSWMTESVETAHGLQIALTLVPKRRLEVPVRVMNVLDHPVTWEKGATVSSLEQVNIMTPTTEETRPVPDLTFKVDLLAAVDEEIQPHEKEALSQLLYAFEHVFSRREYDLGSTYIIDRHWRSQADHTAATKASIAASSSNYIADVRDVKAGSDRTGNQRVNVQRGSSKEKGRFIAILYRLPPSQRGKP